MPGVLVVPSDLLLRIEAFVAAEALPLRLVSSPTAGDETLVEVRQGDRDQQSEASVLIAGGRIRCAVALGMAKRLGLPALALGALLDELDIKVGSCSLGCF